MSSPSVTPASGAVQAAAQYLTFSLGEEQYALEILRVQEIRGYTQPTPMPNTPHHLKGVINLRGSVVPVVGLRERFGLAPLADHKFSVIVLVLVGSRVLGLLVDAVSDVLTLREEDVEPTPQLDGIDTSFILGLAKSGDKLIALLDLARAVGSEQLDAQA